MAKRKPKPKWQWPDWLGGWGIAMSKDGLVQWFSHEAELCPQIPNRWTWAPRKKNGPLRHERMAIPVKTLELLAPDFIPPVISDWRNPVLNPKGGK